MSHQKSRLGFFNDKLMEFFRDLAYAFPEERDLQKAVEYIEMAKRSNPKLILDMFHQHVYLGAHEMIEKDDEEGVVTFAKKKIENEYNEISSALSIFDKHWTSLDNSNREAIWKHLKVLCVLCEKATA